MFPVYVLYSDYVYSVCAETEGTWSFRFSVYCSRSSVDTRHCWMCLHAESTRVLVAEAKLGWNGISCDMFRGRERALYIQRHVGLVNRARGAMPGT